MPKLRLPGRAGKRAPRFGDTVKDDWGSLFMFLWDDHSSGYDNEHWVSVMPLETSTASEPMLVDLDRLEIIE